MSRREYLQGAEKHPRSHLFAPTRPIRLVETFETNDEFYSILTRQRKSKNVLVKKFIFVALKFTGFSVSTISSKVINGDRIYGFSYIFMNFMQIDKGTECKRFIDHRVRWKKIISHVLSYFKDHTEYSCYFS